MEITFEMVRELGIGNGFKVLDPHDGFRKDNRLWFGNCEVCGESVTNSSFDDGVWQHTVYSRKVFYVKDGVANPHPNQSTSQHVDFCPKVAGVEFETIIEYKDI